MFMIFYMWLQKFRKNVELTQDLLDDAAECINKLLPMIQKELNIYSLPEMQFIEYFIGNDMVYGLYSFETGKLWISPHILYNKYNCKNYYSLIFDLIYAMCHELTHYKQHIEGRYSLEKYNSEYKYINNGYM